jgi:hypothetical protein
MMMMILFVTFGTNQHFIVEFVNYDKREFCFTLFNEIINRVLDLLLHIEPHILALFGWVVNIQYVRLSYSADICSNSCVKFFFFLFTLSRHGFGMLSTVSSCERYLWCDGKNVWWKFTCVSEKTNVIFCFGNRSGGFFQHWPISTTLHSVTSQRILFFVHRCNCTLF